MREWWLQGIQHGKRGEPSDTMFTQAISKQGSRQVQIPVRSIVMSKLTHNRHKSGVRTFDGTICTRIVGCKKVLVGSIASMTEVSKRELKFVPLSDSNT